MSNIEKDIVEIVRRNWPKTVFVKSLGFKITSLMISRIFSIFDEISAIWGIFTNINISITNLEDRYGMYVDSHLLKWCSQCVTFHTRVHFRRQTRRNQRNLEGMLRWLWMIRQIYALSGPKMTRHDPKRPRIVAPGLVSTCVLAISVGKVNPGARKCNTLHCSARY